MTTNRKTKSETRTKMAVTGDNYTRAMKSRGLIDKPMRDIEEPFTPSFIRIDLEFGLNFDFWNLMVTTKFNSGRSGRDTKMFRITTVYSEASVGTQVPVKELRELIEDEASKTRFIVLLEDTTTEVAKGILSLRSHPRLLVILTNNVAQGNPAPGDPREVFPWDVDTQNDLTRVLGHFICGDGKVPMTMETPLDIVANRIHADGIDDVDSVIQAMRARLTKDERVAFSVDQLVGIPDSATAEMLNRFAYEGEESMIKWINEVWGARP